MRKTVTNTTIRCEDEKSLSMRSQNPSMHVCAVCVDTRLLLILRYNSVNCHSLSEHSLLFLALSLSPHFFCGWQSFLSSRSSCALQIRREHEKNERKKQKKEMTLWWWKIHVCCACDHWPSIRKKTLNIDDNKSVELLSASPLLICILIFHFNWWK